MVTDRPPRRAKSLAEFVSSDQSVHLPASADDRLRSRAAAIESAMQAAKPAAISYACSDFLSVASDFYKVQRTEVRVLAARPLRVREGGWSMELFGDYNPETSLIRIWTRTAVRKQVTSYGTFLSTLCHEFCWISGSTISPIRRTRAGFTSAPPRSITMPEELPPKQLAWVKMPNGRWRIDWNRMRAKTGAMAGRTAAIVKEE